jgi:hypothetical protein
MKIIPERCPPEPHIHDNAIIPSFSTGLIPLPDLSLNELLNYTGLDHDPYHKNRQN